MSRINKFEDLEVWQMSREICRDLEELFNTTALGNRYSLLNQMDRSSGSIMDNIAEGFGRGGNKEFRYFLSFSRGSCHEFSYEQFKGLSDKCNVQNVKLLSFINYLSRTDYKGIKFK